jgi:diguanylate cyclase (GGDEF)-like protein
VCPFPDTRVKARAARTDTAQVSRTATIGRSARIAMVVAPLIGVMLIACRIAGGDAAFENVGLPTLSTSLLTLAAAVCVRQGIRAPEDRVGWFAFAAAIASWTLGDAVRAVAYPVDRPHPSIVDPLYLGFYPGAAAGLVLLARRRVRHFTRSLVLDGVMAVLAVGALTAAVVVPGLDAALGGEERATALMNTVYPLADMALLAVVTATIALTGWRPAPQLARIAVALVVWSAVDTAYVEASLRYGDTVTWLGAGWVLSVLLLASATSRVAHGEARRRGPRDGWRLFLVPLVVAPICIAFLAVGFVVRLPVAAGALAAASLVVSIVRTGVTFRENLLLLETRRQSLTDELTDLANRRRLNARLQEVFATAPDPSAPFGLLLIDLNRFKVLNDTLGHHVGDRLLTELGPRLLSALPGADVVARLGGDEFAVLLTDGVDAQRLADAAGRIAAALDETFVLDGLELQVSASIGGALSPQQASTAAELLQRADIAMYQAKRRHAGYTLYEAGRDEHSRDRLALGEELRRGVAAGELEVHYQPQADLHTGRITGVEALVRWQHPERGLLAPDVFIPLAEELGLMAGVTRHVLRDATAQASRWRAHHGDLSVSVNLSMANLLDPNLTMTVQDALGASGLPAAALVLEVTEDVVMVDPERMLTTLGSLADLGVEIALDDFGTGHSSLAYLKRLPLREVKIDRSFVMRMGEDVNDAAIVRLTADLGRALGLRVVAEGVEHREAWDELDRVGCHVAQGYLLSKPVPAVALTPLLAAPAYQTSPERQSHVSSPEGSIGAETDQTKTLPSSSGVRTAPSGARTDVGPSHSLQPRAA